MDIYILYIIFDKHILGPLFGIPSLYLKNHENHSFLLPFVIMREICIVPTVTVAILFVFPATINLLHNTIKTYFHDNSKYRMII